MAQVQRPIYIVIKNMKVINANLSSSYFSADLSQNAYLGFVHHLARFLDEKFPKQKQGLFAKKATKTKLGKEEAFAIIQQLDFNLGYASLVGHINDNNHKKLNIPMNPPEIKGTIKQTLVMSLEVQSRHDNLRDWVAQFLLFHRFSGGDIQSNASLSIEIIHGDNNLTESLQWQKGWVVVDATDQLIEKATATNYSTAFCDFLATFKTIEQGKTKKEDKISYKRHHKGWFYASLQGYQLLEAPKHRHGARYGHPHAFAEPIIGLHELKYFKIKETHQLFWRSEFKNNTYLLKQT